MNAATPHRRLRPARVLALAAACALAALPWPLSGQNTTVDASAVTAAIDAASSPHTFGQQPLPPVLPLPPLTPAMVSPVVPPTVGLHLPDFNIHDPWILADASTKTYYLYSAASTRRSGYNRSGTFFYRSQDLKNWDGPYLAFLIPDGTWANPQANAWAPEVHFFHGKYYLFTTLHNPEKIIEPTAPGAEPKMMRSTMIAVSDSPEGPFKLLQTDRPVAPPNFMTLDGTFYVDPDGHPWMVYAHEWVQKMDGTMEALPLADDLSAAAGQPIYLFKASDAPWIDGERTPNASENHYVTDGPEMWRTKDGHLLMIWSSYNNEGYVETVARSTTGTLKGPWVQLDPIVLNDSGHGMLFRAFDGQLMLCIGQPFSPQHAKIYEMEDAGDHLNVVKFRDDLSGPPLAPGARQASLRSRRAGASPASTSPAPAQPTNAPPPAASATPPAS